MTAAAKSALQDLFEYHFWATTELLHWCAKLPPEDLELTAPGTYGSIIETFTHLVQADNRYLFRLTNQNSAAAGWGDRAPLPELESAFLEQAQRWNAVLGRLDQIDVTIHAHDDWPETPHVTNLLVAQALHHGNDHRTHIGSILGAAGREVPDLDVWSFWIATRVQ